jgi:hypothetical protein
MKKKVSYVNLLKEAISEYDVKSFDYKGPMTEPIIGYTGDGEMETNKDAASILERYYFNEKSDSGVNVMEQTAEEPDPEEKNEIVTGDTPDDIEETMDDFEDEILDDESSIEEALDLSEDIDLLGEEDYIGDADDLEEGVAGAVLGGALGSALGPAGTVGGAAAGHMAQKKFLPDNESDEMTMESAILEKLIEEMENEEEGEKEGEKADQPGVTDGEQGDVEAAKDEPLDVDKKVAKESFPIGPLSKASGKSDKTAKEEIEEAFKIFTEEIMMEEDDGETPAGNEEAGAAGKEKPVEDELDKDDLGLQKEDLSLEEDLDFLGEDFLAEEDEEEAGEEKEEEEEEEEEKKEKVKPEEVSS